MTINLSELIRNNKIDELEQAIKEGVDINKANEDGDFPLFTALYIGNLEAMALLCRSGADLTIKDPLDGSNILHKAVIISDMDRIELLMAHSKEDIINAIDYSGSTPLHYLSSISRIEVLTALSDTMRLNSESLEIKDFPTEIKSHIIERIEIAKYLLDRGVNANIKNYTGLTALDIAKDGDIELPELINLLEEYTR